MGGAAKCTLMWAQGEQPHISFPIALRGHLCRFGLKKTLLRKELSALKSHCHQWDGGDALHRAE